MMSGIITAALMILFIGITWWAYSDHQKTRFNEAQMLPLVDDERESEEPV